MKSIKLLKNTVLFFLCFSLAAAVFVLIINSHVKSVGEAYILSAAAVSAAEDIDCIIVLGCQVKPDGSPSDMLRDRLQMGIELYNDGVAPKLLMSGDHGQEEYDEVNTMKDFAIESGVPSEDVFMDHAGFSTYESMYRAKEIFGAEKVIVVTQKYHLSRALYIADKLEIEAYGVSSDYHQYTNQVKRECREILARFKDFFITIWKPEPTYLGEVIPISGDGNSTNDKNSSQ